MTEMADSSEVSFSRVMNSLPRGGIAQRNAWGRTMYRSVWNRERPRARAASLWPLSMLLMAVR